MGHFRKEESSEALNRHGVINVEIGYGVYHQQEFSKPNEVNMGSQAHVINKGRQKRSKLQQ